MNDTAQPNRSRLGYVKGFVFVVFGALIIYGAEPLEKWPFVHWTMYSTGVPEQTTSYAVHALYATDESGQEVRLPISELYTLDDDIHAQPDGRFRAQGVAGGDVGQHYEVLQLAEDALGRTVTQLDVRMEHFAIDYSQMPPIDEPYQSDLLIRLTPGLIEDVRRLPLAEPTNGPVLRLGDTFELLDVFIERDTLSACDWLYVRTWWRTTERPDLPYSTTFTLADANGVGIAQTDYPPDGDYLILWPPGHTEADLRVIEVPCDTEPGTYNLLTAMYDPATMQLLPVTNPDGAALGEYAFLSAITVQ